MTHVPGFSVPSPFLEHPGTPAIPFRTWIRIFENYLQAAFPGKLLDDRKCAILLNAIGTEGQRLFYNSIPPESTYKATLTALEQLFTPKSTVCAERHRFRKRYQLPEEPVDRYVAALREMPPNCAFGPLEDEMIRDQLIEGISSEGIRERLLSIPDLTLEKALIVSQEI
ncbi:hypothetical protein M513_12332 [Trichuris suis]|uniref:Retrotransposon gag domain-containing protein n=1 Tax=Trichuris suis TaxID=68888 RepID=A0A085LPA8_9BILA|nr:hypothetical protein M513_12332 [Trichuris suis]